MIQEKVYNVNTDITSNQSIFFRHFDTHGAKTMQET